VMTVLERELPEDARTRVHACARRARATPFAVIASGVLGGMQELSGDQVAGLTFHHHGRFAPSSYRTLGLFTQAVPLHLRGASGSRLDTVHDVFLRSLQVSDHILPLRIAGDAWSEDLMSLDRASGVFLGLEEAGSSPPHMRFAGTSAQAVELVFDGGARAQDTIVIAWDLHEARPQVTATYNKKAFSPSAVNQLLQAAITRVDETFGES